MNEVRQGLLDVGLEVVVAKGEGTTSQQEEEEKDGGQDTSPDRPALPGLFWR